MKKNFIVIGLGRFGSNVAITLAETNSDVLAVDIDKDAVKSVSKKVPHCVIADATNLDVLTELGAGSIDHAVVAIGNNLEASILTIVNLKKLNVKKITVRADEEGHKELFKLIGATEVIIPEENAAVFLANQIKSDSIIDYYIIDKDYVMVKINVGKKFISRTLADLNIRNEFDVNIVGIVRNDEFRIPHGTDYICANDVVVVAGKDPNILKLDQFFNK
jgi:trk system potassium uptake protein TrkA